MDMLFDPPRHERLPINDDETSTALAAQGLADAPVTLLTFDTSQAARARRTGLTVKKLTKPPDRDHRPEARPLHSLRYSR